MESDQLARVQPADPLRNPMAPYPEKDKRLDALRQPFSKRRPRLIPLIPGSTRFIRMSHG